MKDFWNILGAIAAVIAIIVSIFVFFYDKSEKAQKVEINLLSRTSFINPLTSSSNHHLEISYNGKKLNDYMTFQFKISNTGGQPIRSSDFESPLGVKIENAEEILWAEQINSEPNNIKISTSVKSDSIELSNSLLNPADSYIIEVAVIPKEDVVPLASPIGRIAGVKEIQFTSAYYKKSDIKQYIETAMKLFLILQVIIILLLEFSSRRLRKRNSSSEISKS